MAVLGEIVVLTVFENKEPVGLEQSTLDNQVGQRGQLLQSVGRVGKDEVELLFAGLDETECVAADCYHIGDSPPVIRSGGGPSAKLLQAVLNEAVVVAIEFNADDVTAASREQFKGNAARAGEEVEGLGTVEVDVLNEHVEDVLLGKIRRRPRLERARNIEVAALVFSCNDSHTLTSYILPLTSYILPLTSDTPAWCHTACHRSA